MMGVQNNHYDIVNKQERKADQNMRLLSKKVNGISEFTHVTHMTAPKINQDYQKAFQADNTIFRRGQGLLSKLANSAASHKVLIPSFKKA